MLADLPENYSDPKVLEVLRDLPTSWNETRVLAAEIGKYVIIARRSGNSWYVAGITNEEPRDIVINCDFLGNNLTYTGKSIQDLETSHYLKEPETYKVDSLLLKVDDTLKLHMAEGGGFLIRLQSQD
jgi:alpha-glucosidase